MGEKNLFDKRKSLPRSEPAVHAGRAEQFTPEGSEINDQLSFPSFVPTLPPVTAPCPLEYIFHGPPVTPEQHIKGYSEDEFESFIREWAFHYKQIKQKAYAQVGRFGGAGDMGRDVVGYIDPPSSNGKLDIYQCKHYGHGLYPSDVWTELGKLCYFTFIGAFAVPEEYLFVCPEDVGPDLGRLLEKPEDLRQRLMDEWGEHVEGVIKKRKKIKLEGNLLDHIKAFDFKRVGYKPIHEIIEEFRTTPRYPTRFGGGLIIPRSPNKTPPAEIEEHEQRYVEQLIEAYQDHKGSEVKLDTLSVHSELEGHFTRSRVRYFCAETLRLDVRDNLPDGVTFEQVQDQVLDAVADICDNRKHASGYDRVNAVTDHAGNYVVQDHPLRGYVNSQVLKGACHQLANINKLKWVPK